MVTSTSTSPKKALPNLPELDVTRVSASKHKGPTETSLVSSIEYDRTAFEPAPRPPRQKHQPWRPHTQKPYFLMAVSSASIGLVVLLQVLLARSQRDDGIIFAPDVNKLPPGQTFCYLYLPTLISLLLSFTWTWIDVDVKRLQPFWQLSRVGGARGKDSILLHYPFDFVATVPFKAIRQRHWPVFSASSAMVLILWGLTPLQSGIFATETVTRTSQLPMTLSTDFASLSEQDKSLTSSYVQSVYNIAWLNETLQPFMSREAMLAPFGISQQPLVETAENWTATTLLYSVDLNCEIGSLDNGTLWRSNTGCKHGNSDPPLNMRDDQYMSTYVGYWGDDAMDLTLMNACPPSSPLANRTSFIQWSRGAKPDNGLSQPLAANTLFCASVYYQQEVNATVIPPRMSVAKVVPIGQKQPLPSDLFNVTEFEMSMSSSTEAVHNRGDVPGPTYWPDATERLMYLDLVYQFQNYLPAMTGFAVSAYQRAAADYMDPDLLKDSYQAAYRLLFARRLAGVLSSKLHPHHSQTILRAYQTQAIVLVPSFVYIVEALVGLTGTVAIVLLVLSHTTQNHLQSDPANIASLMALTSEDSTLRRELAPYNQSEWQDLEGAFKDSTFGLLSETKLDTGEGYGIKIFGHQSLKRSVSRAMESADRVLPRELYWTSGLAFIAVQFAIIVALIYAFAWSGRTNGMPLPSSTMLINQLVENYIPMVIAAFFEPIWVVLNRVLCMLQPYEQLRKGNALASQSLTIDYSSLPPQAVVLRALSAGHYSLALICTMAILANLLSVAFNSILFEDTVTTTRNATFNQPYQLPLHGASIGNDSFSVSKCYYDPFYLAISHLTAGTPLPSWTDENFFYVPFNNQTVVNATNDTQQATVSAIGASLDCVPLSEEGSNTYTYYSWAHYIYVNVTVSFPGTSSRCHLSFASQFRNYPTGQSAMEIFMFDEVNKSSDCSNIMLAGWLRTNGTPSNWWIASPEGPLTQTWMACRPEVHISSRELTVDKDSSVMSSQAGEGAVSSINHAFYPNRSSLITSIHKVLGQNDSDSAPYAPTLGPTWHNDTFSSDFLTYLTVTTYNNSDVLDPTLPPPTFEQTVAPISSIYNKLFAIILGMNLEKVLQPDGETKIPGRLLGIEKRLFVSKPMFIVSIVILTLYMMATAVVFIRRPWRILPRMPTTIASQVAFFAASHALEDLRGKAPMTAEGRNMYVESLGVRYGFGRFLGSDGKAHIGVEREPLVQILKKDDLRMQQK